MASCSQRIIRKDEETTAETAAAMAMAANIEKQTERSGCVA